MTMSDREIDDIPDPKLREAVREINDLHRMRIIREWEEEHPLIRDWIGQRLEWLRSQRPISHHDLGQIDLLHEMLERLVANDTRICLEDKPCDGTF